MHPTADTPLVMNINRLGRRVMPGVRPLVAEPESQGFSRRVLTKENGCDSRAEHDLVP